MKYAGLGSLHTPEQYKDFAASVVDDVKARHAHIRKIGFVKPLKPLLKVILPYCPLLEIGAGTGAMAKAITLSGGVVDATDNYSWAYYGITDWVGSRFPVRKIDAVQAVTTIADGYNLLCSWPPYKSDWCRRAAKALPVGRFFLLIGEGPGGCTGNDRLFDLLDSRFTRVGDADVRPWFGMHDHLVIYQKVR